MSFNAVSVSLENCNLKNIKIRKITFLNLTNTEVLLRKKYTKGFTLIELIMVISIIGILAAIVVPTYGGYVKKAKEEICRVNCLQLERDYEMHLETERIEHGELAFEKFLNEYVQNVCPGNGVITCVEGNVKCSAHTIEINDDGEVPYL